MVELRRTRLCIQTVSSTHSYLRPSHSYTDLISVHSRVRITQGSPVSGAATQDLPRRKAHLSPPVADINWNLRISQKLGLIGLVLKQHIVKSEIISESGWEVLKHDTWISPSSLIPFCLRARFPTLAVCAGSNFQIDRPPSVLKRNTVFWDLLILNVV